MLLGKPPRTDVLAVLLFSARDHQGSRSKLLAYTVPVSLAGLPAVVLPGGIQVVGHRGDYGQLLAFSSALSSIHSDIEL